MCKGPFKQMCIRILGYCCLSRTILQTAVSFWEICFRKSWGDIGLFKKLVRTRFWGPFLRLKPPEGSKTAWNITRMGKFYTFENLVKLCFSFVGTLRKSVCAKKLVVGRPCAKTLTLVCFRFINFACPELLWRKPCSFTSSFVKFSPNRVHRKFWCTWWCGYLLV